MNKYKNNVALKAIGIAFKERREFFNLDIEDIVEMTGFTYKKIYDFENGEETSISYFIELSLAVNTHPKDLLNIPLRSEPRFKLSETRKEKSRLTSRIMTYFSNDYFQIPRKTNDIVLKLREDFNVTVESKNVSAILGRLAKNNILKIKKDGARNLYHK
ncbi:transcriptional regulator [Flavobacterium tegetincola]|uniref:transcriptional regulator n=1 Tax=Flavobacterium tegetincola TaxID=150172 RepID=UPI00042607EB|nr:transcriptional regulator [Flavobacterium tegetincola]